MSKLKLYDASRMPMPDNEQLMKMTEKINTLGGDEELSYVTSQYRVAGIWNENKQERRKMHHIVSLSPKIEDTTDESKVKIVGTSFVEVEKDSEEATIDIWERYGDYWALPTLKKYSERTADFFLDLAQIYKISLNQTIEEQGIYRIELAEATKVKQLKKDGETNEKKYELVTPGKILTTLSRIAALPESKDRNQLKLGK